MYPEKKGGSHKMARTQQNWGLLTLLTRWASIWTMPNTASPKSEPPCGRAVYTPVRATILGHPPQGGEFHRKWWKYQLIKWLPITHLNFQQYLPKANKFSTEASGTSTVIELQDPFY